MEMSQITRHSQITRQMTLLPDIELLAGTQKASEPEKHLDTQPIAGESGCLVVIK